MTLAGQADRFSAAPETECVRPDGSSDCVDLHTELTDCGACGLDCTTVPYAAGVGCDAGACVIRALAMLRLRLG